MLVSFCARSFNGLSLAGRNFSFLCYEYDFSRADESSAQMAGIMSVDMLSIELWNLADVASEIFNVIYDKHCNVEGFTSVDFGEILHLIRKICHLVLIYLNCIYITTKWHICDVFEMHIIVTDLIFLQVEGCDPLIGKCREDAGSLSCGPYQIKEAYWVDCYKPGTGEFTRHWAWVYWIFHYCISSEAGSYILDWWTSGNGLSFLS